MTILYLASFIIGLLLAVQIMINGVERSRETNPSAERSFRVSPLVIVAFSTWFGAIGYLTTRFSVGSPAARFGMALVPAVLAAAIAARLVRKWWTVVPEHDVDDERYVLQGQLARVTKAISSEADGEVTFSFGRESRVLRARSLDSGPIPPNEDVVIERIEDDVAYVEAWAEVEKRL